METIKEVGKSRTLLSLKSVIAVSVVLALLTGLAYSLAALGVLSAGLNPEEAPAGIAWLAGGCYVVGGLLILTRRRGLLIFGAVINTLVVTLFVLAYIGRPEVMLSPAGIATKLPQIVLEVGLFYLIVVTGRGDGRKGS